MKLEQQVCSLELAKRLKELGVEQKSFWYWCDILIVGDANPNRWGWQLLARAGQGREFYSAFTVAELGEMLPNYFKHEQRGYINLAIMKLDDERWEVMYKERTDIAFVERANAEADARAKMLIYLLENKLIKL